MVIYSAKHDYFIFGGTETNHAYFYLNVKKPTVDVWLQHNIALGHSKIFKEIRGF